MSSGIQKYGHPVLRWMMDNIYIRTDPAGNIKPDKEKSTEKIDGAVATVMVSSGIQKYGRMLYLSSSSKGGNTSTKAVMSVVEDKSSPP